MRCRASRLAALLFPLLAACVPTPLVPPTNLSNDPAVLKRMNAEGDRMIVITVENPVEAVPLMAGTTAGSYGAAPGYAAYGSARATVSALAQQYGLEEVTAWPIPELKVHCAVLEVKDGVSRDEMIAKLAKDQRVRIAQPLQSFRTLGTASSTYDANYVDMERGLREIDAPAAQRVSRGEGVRVAVIDTGVDTSHPDLSGRVAMVRDFVELDRAHFKSDVHGTAVAGVIAANPAGGHGVLGVAPQATILALKACWQMPAPGHEHAAGPSVCNSLTLAQALVAAIEAHAQVINLSLSGPPDPLLAQLVDYALEHGAVVVGATPPDGDLHAFPVGIPKVIPVDLPGAQVTGALSAPGHDVLTLTPGGHYDFLSGSSFSAAYVSGIAALLLAVSPHLDASKVYAVLKSSTKEGAGGPMVNACAALAAVTNVGCPAS